MPDIILHHYPASLFSEKIRLLLGAKRLAWRSVTIPVIMPKPDLMALTGGYRKTPVLQIGADIYCDTALIASKLDQLAPQPPLYPPAYAAGNLALARWADSTLFWCAVTLRFQPAALAKLGGDFGASMADFSADRASLSKGATTRPVPLDEATATVAQFFHELDAQLTDGRSFLFGSLPALADFSVYHNLWFLKENDVTAPWVSRHARVHAWFERMRAFGHGTHSDMDSADAVRIAHDSAPAAMRESSELEPFAVGSAVEVLPVDYGLSPTAGTLVACTADEFAVQRTDERAGEVVVHFPRINFAIRKAK